MHIRDRGAPHTDKLRVLVVAEDSLARAGIAALVEGLQECVVVGQTGGDEKLLDELEIYQPDIIVWDLGMDATQPLESLAGLHSSDTPVLTLVPAEDIAGKTASLGISGILSRQVEGQPLLAAMKAIVEGLTVIDSRFAETLLTVPESIPEPLEEPLTPRELEVLQLLAQGMANKSIASRLEISEHTVKFHVNSILSKFGAQSRTEAVSLGTRFGLIKF